METLEDVFELSVVLVQVVADVIAMLPDEDEAVVGEGVRGLVELAQVPGIQVRRLHVLPKLVQQRREYSVEKKNHEKKIVLT